MTKTIATLLASTLGLVGCSERTQENKIWMQTEGMPSVEQRYRVKRVAIFEDDIAYNSTRGIYEITDLKTGKEYLGISGIGISERGSHSTGKTSFSDER